MNKQIILRGCLSIAATVSLQAAAQAQAGVEQSAQTTTVVGAPQVIDSYMKPTVVRTRETTDGDGNVSKTVEPIIQERHEKVMIPTIETTSTELRSAGTTNVRTETHAVATANSSSAVPRVAHHPRHHRSYAAHHAQQSLSTRTTTIEQPTTIERQDRTTERDTLIERRDPSLDQQ